MDKKGLEMSFALIFAIIVGAFILFGAIYAATQFINSGQDIEQTKAAKEISIIFNPLETGMASGRASIVSLNPEARIYNKCDSEGSFGSQEFSVSQKSGFKKEWSLPGGGITIYNKYVFSDEVEQGKEIYFFSKPFNMPFKVSEIIFMNTEKYCFINPPDFIEEEISQLDIKNIRIANCSQADIKVCFSSSSGCNISVYGDCNGICDITSGDYEFGHVIKDGKTLYYTGSLLYGAVFAEPEIYNCNFKRLMLRIKQISYLYKDEASFLATRGCGDAIVSNLVQLAQAAENAESPNPSSILMLNEAKEALDSQNSRQTGCGIY